MILAIPAPQARNPVAKSPRTIARCLFGRLSLRTVLIGRKTTINSVTVLIMPAARRCASSLMHFFEARPIVQYAEMGLFFADS